MFFGNFDKRKKAQYFYHAAIGDMGNGIASCGKKGIGDAGNAFQDITSLSLFAFYKNIGISIRIVLPQNSSAPVVALEFAAA